MSSEWVERQVSDGRYSTRYIEAGDPTAEPMVLLHDGAWGGSSTVTWGNLVPRLAERFYVLAPDMLGFGGSDKAVFVDRSSYAFRIEHLLAYLDAVGVSRPVHVVGNSFGGSLALRLLATEHRHRIASVTSIAGTGGPWRSALALENLGHWDGTENDLRRIVDLLVGPGPHFENQLHDRLEWASVPGHYRAMSAPSIPLPDALKSTRPHNDDWPHQLNGIAIATPVLLVRGSRDVLLDEDWTTHLTAVLSNVTVQTLDCRHSPNIDRPAELGEVLNDFIDDVNASSRGPAQCDPIVGV